jgi:uncharacterized protein YciI
MKNYFLICILTFFNLSCSEKNHEKENSSPLAAKSAPKASITYDSLLAKKAGADDYGMRQYVLAYLKRGPNRDLSKEEATKLQRAHMDNIGRMARLGKLVIAGPFMDDTEIRGIYIFAVETVEEAEELTKTDPAIQAGSLIMELHPWYGPAALVLIEDLQKKIRKTKI